MDCTRTESSYMCEAVPTKEKKKRKVCAIVLVYRLGETQTRESLSQHAAHLPLSFPSIFLGTHTQYHTQQSIVAGRG